MAQLQFVRRMGILVAGAMILLGLCSILETEEAHAQDLGRPDSVYYLPFEFTPTGCSREVQIHVPVYLSTDGYAMWYEVNLTVLGYLGCDSVVPRFLVPCEAPDAPFACNNGDFMGFASKCYSDFCTPGRGIAGDFYFRALPGDTVSLQPTGYECLLSDYFWSWSPTYMDLDTQFVVPTEFDIPSGDVDASGLVTISDAVYLIQFIFSGGCAPWSLSSADPNADCSNTVSDVVYLINYIFAGGPPPQAGCVGL